MLLGENALNFVYFLLHLGNSKVKLLFISHRTVYEQYF